MFAEIVANGNEEIIPNAETSLRLPRAKPYCCNYDVATK